MFGCSASPNAAPTPITGVSNPSISADGQMGLQGIQGAKGDPGTNGTDGVNGNDGLPGTDGLPGKDSTPGLNGSPGTVGPQGSQGSQGVPGNDGQRGLQGIQGMAGVAGVKGDKGDPGILGFTRARFYQVYKIVGAQTYTLPTNGTSVPLFFQVTCANSNDIMVSGACTYSHPMNTAVPSVYIPRYNVSVNSTGPSDPSSNLSNSMSFSCEYELTQSLSVGFEMWGMCLIGG